MTAWSWPSTMPRRATLSSWWRARRSTHTRLFSRLDASISDPCFRWVSRVRALYTLPASPITPPPPAKNRVRNKLNLKTVISLRICSWSKKSWWEPDPVGSDAFARFSSVLSSWSALRWYDSATLGQISSFSSRPLMLFSCLYELKKLRNPQNIGFGWLLIEN